MAIGIYVWDADGNPQFDGTVRTSRITGTHSLSISVPASGWGGMWETSFVPEGGADFCYIAGEHPGGSDYGLYAWVDGGVIRVRAFEKPPFSQPTNYGVRTIVYGRF